MPEAQVEPEHVIGSIAPGVVAQDAVQELKTLIIRLEKTVNAQARAFLALVLHDGLDHLGRLGRDEEHGALGDGGRHVLLKVT